MTDEMLELAATNGQRTGANNLQFLKGTIEGRPAARRVGVRGHLHAVFILSVAVFILSVDKPR